MHSYITPIAGSGVVIRGKPGSGKASAVVNWKTSFVECFGTDRVIVRSSSTFGTEAIRSHCVLMRIVQIVEHYLAVSPIAADLGSILSRLREEINDLLDAQVCIQLHSN